VPRLLSVSLEKSSYGNDGEGRGVCPYVVLRARFKFQDLQCGLLLSCLIVSVGSSSHEVTHTKESILQNARSRLGNFREDEVEVALGEIAKIARLRLRDLVETGSGARAKRR
jgi:hypothetical protein